MRWEYLIEPFDPDVRRTNAAGAAGWELVCSVPYSKHTTMLVYKRPVEPAKLGKRGPTTLVSRARTTQPVTA